MSIQNLLNPETKNEKWSNLQCNEINTIKANADEVNALVINADDFFGNGIAFLADSFIQPSNLTLNVGSGTISQVKSVICSTETAQGKFIDLTGSFTIIGYTAPVINGGGSFGIVQLQLAIDTLYPAGPNQNIPGIANASVRLVSGNALQPSSTYLTRGDTSADININIETTSDISVNTTTARVHFHMKLKIA